MEATFNVGFSTYDGTVSASKRWGGERQTFQINPGLPDSYEQLLHEVSFRTPQPAAALPDFMLLMRTLLSGAKPIPNLQVLSDPPRLQRAIGVRYVKATERQSHYFHTTLPLQFDAMLHFDRTSHLRPLMPAAREVQIEEEAEDAGARPASEDEDEEMEG